MNEKARETRVAFGVSMERQVQQLNAQRSAFPAAFHRFQH